MTNVKNCRQKNSIFLAQLIIDQKFYKEILQNYNEEELREKLKEAKEKTDAEDKKIREILSITKRKQPTENETKEYMKLKKEQDLIEKEINELMQLKVEQEKGIKTIENIERLIKIIDRLSYKEVKKLNNL